ncbi:MAG: universal stress protein [Deltaproteobacteria bacterium]|nr:universal stress protein [Deltaproteobacteria bacterium]
MKSKVLIPVDRSRNSLTAEEYAIKLSWKMPLKVTLLNVLNTKRLSGHGIGPSQQELILESMRRQAERVLAEAAKPFEKADIEHDTRIESGAPGQVICGVAENEGYDLLIIPQSGLSELEEILGGSVVRNVLNHCQVPILLVKHTSEQLEQQRKLRAEQELLPR